MKKAKGKMELRYYDIPQNEFLIALQNQNWQNKYQTEEDGLHFHNLLEIGLCVQGYGIMRLEEENVHFETGMLSIIPRKFPAQHDAAGTGRKYMGLLICRPGENPGIRLSG